MTNITVVMGAGSDEFRDYILRNPHTLVYSEPRFLELVSNHLCARCAWLVLRRNGEISALLPFLMKDGPLGRVYNSLAYYGSNGGVIQADQEPNSKSELIKAFYDMAADAKAASATIISNPLQGDSKFYDTHASYDFLDERIGQITQLPSSVEDLMARFENPRPRNIRRAMKEGITVARGANEALEFLFSTHVANITAIGGLAKERSFFDAIPTTMLTRDWAIFTASLDGKPIAALLVFYFNRTVEYFTPVIIESYRNTQALSLVIYEAMRDAIHRGYSNWNWGGTWLNQGGVYDFKKKWGTSEFKYYYYTRIMNAELITCKPAYLLQQYPGFYLVPFNQLTCR